MSGGMLVQVQLLYFEDCPNWKQTRRIYRQPSAHIQSRTRPS